jgi:hypothetical protein
MVYVLYREGRRYMRWHEMPALAELLRVIAFGRLVRGFSIDLPDFALMAVPGAGADAADAAAMGGE